MKCAAAPFLGSDIGDGFGEVPAVAPEVLSVVLALSVGLVLRFSQDDGTVLSRTLAVALSIFDANLNDVRMIGYNIAFGDGEAAVASFHLDAVIGDAKTDSKAKGFRQPIGGGVGIGINENRNHNAGRDRSVEAHWETLSLRSGRNLVDGVPMRSLKLSGDYIPRLPLGDFDLAA